jgi:hypothetical protein
MFCLTMTRLVFGVKRMNGLLPSAPNSEHRPVPQKLSPVQLKVLCFIVRYKVPADYGIDSYQWTGNILQQLLETQVGCASGNKRYLQNSGQRGTVTIGSRKVTCLTHPEDFETLAQRVAEHHREDQTDLFGNELNNGKTAICEATATPYPTSTLAEDSTRDMRRDCFKPFFQLLFAHGQDSGTGINGLGLGGGEKGDSLVRVVEDEILVVLVVIHLSDVAGVWHIVHSGRGGATECVNDIETRDCRKLV